MAGQKLLLVELWGLGDLTMATTFLRQAVNRYEVYLLGKPHTQSLLRESYPQVHFIAWDAPWTAFSHKYRLWRWDWAGIFALLARLRKERFALAVSVRRDPRDHFLMWLTGAKERAGFPRGRSRWFLTRNIAPLPEEPHHRVADWRQINAALNLPGESEPWLHANAPRPVAPPLGKTRIVLHTGARIAVRRWPEAYFAAIVEKMRTRFSFELILVPDPDGYGIGLGRLADDVRERLTIEQLTDLLRGADLLICNDSGPMHMAAALGTPTISFFGPTDARVFAPWGADHKLIQRDICPYRPCFDYCRLPEPLCLTKLLPSEVWPEIEETLHAWGVSRILPASFFSEPSGLSAGKRE